MDLKWSEVTSNVNFGHPKWPIDLKWPEMRSKVIFGHPKWPPKKIKFDIDLKWPELLSKVNFRHPKCSINLKWPEITSKVIFEHPKCPPPAILSQIKNILYGSEMARNAIEYEFLTSKMGASGHFVNKNRTDLKWPEMPSKVNFGHPKWPTAAI